MKRLIITGFACPTSAWENLFPQDSNQRILTLSEVISRSQKTSLRTLGKIVRDEILCFRPDSLVLHDFGLTIGILGLLGARKKDSAIGPRLLLFNGALRGFDIFRAWHPIVMQFIGVAHCRDVVGKCDGLFDPSLIKHFGEIRRLYREVIAASLLEKLRRPFLKSEPLGLDFGNKVLILASRNDPFIPFATVEKLSVDLLHSKIEHLDYGHFPYSGDLAALRFRIQNFESDHSA